MYAFCMYVCQCMKKYFINKNKGLIFSTHTIKLKKKESKTICSFQVKLDNSDISLH